MENEKDGFKSVDEYIGSFPEDIQRKLQEIRYTIKAAAPDAEEKISYQMPTFYLKGNLVHYAAHSNHIGFYPTSSGIAAFKDDLRNYESSKGAVRFPMEQPLPLKLISKIVQFRVEENLKKGERKPRSKN